MLEQFSAITSRGAESLSEIIKEATIKNDKESPLKASMELIENVSLESLIAQNNDRYETFNAERVSQLEKNREDGANREEVAHEELQHEFPEEHGYKIEREQYLRDIDGNIVKDPETGEARRIDFTVTKNGEVVKSIEVTSEIAPKDAQIAKEARIRYTGGNYVKDRDTGQLIEMPKGTQTEVRRYA